MAELEAGNSGTEAGRVFSEVRQGLAGGEAWACGLVPLELKKPRLRPGSVAEFSSSFWMGLREWLGRVHLLYYGTTGFALGNPLIDKERTPAQPVVVRSKLEGAVRSKLEKSRGFFLLHSQGSQGPLFEGCFSGR